MEVLVECGRKEFLKPKRFILMDPEAEICAQMGRFRGNGFLAQQEVKLFNIKSLF